MPETINGVVCTSLIRKRQPIEEMLADFRESYVEGEYEDEPSENVPVMRHCVSEIIAGLAASTSLTAWEQERFMRNFEEALDEHLSASDGEKALAALGKRNHAD